MRCVYAWLCQLNFVPTEVGNLSECGAYAPGSLVGLSGKLARDDVVKLKRKINSDQKKDG